MSAKKLTPKQLRFVEEYLVDQHRANAYIRAGYSPNGADRAAHTLLKNLEIQRLIQNRMDMRAAKCDVSIDRVVEELAKIGFSNFSKFTKLAGRQAYVDFSDCTEADLALVQEIVQDEYTEGKGDDAREVRRTRVKLHPKLPALEQLMRHLLLDAGKPTSRVAFEDREKALQQLAELMDGTTSSPSANSTGNGQAVH